MNESTTLEDEAKALNDALYAILRWDVDNVIPDDLHERARAALKPQFAPAAVHTELVAALEKVERLITYMAAVFYLKDLQDRFPSGRADEVKDYMAGKASV